MLSNEEKRMIMKILKKRGSREKGGGGNEIHAPCACGYSWNIVESGVKHHQTNKQSEQLIYV